MTATHRTGKLLHWLPGLLLILAFGCAVLGADNASAETGPKWKLYSMASTQIEPGDGNDSTAEHRYAVQVYNVGDSFALASTAHPLVFEAVLPPGVTVVSVNDSQGPWPCAGVVTGASSFTCATETAGIPRYAFQVYYIDVSVAPGVVGVRSATFKLSGGNVPEPGSISDPTVFTMDPPAFGVDAFDASANDSSGAVFTKAARHPYEFVTEVDFASKKDPRFPSGNSWPVEPIRDAFAELPPGFIGNPTIAAQCTIDGLVGTVNSAPACSPTAQIGLAAVRTNRGNSAPGVSIWPLYNMVPPPGVAARFGFNIAGVLTFVDSRLQPGGEYKLVTGSHNTSEGLAIVGAGLTFWGVPSDPSHDLDRPCPNTPGALASTSCEGDGTGRPFFRMPTSCTAPGESTRWSMHANSWFNSGAVDRNGFPDLSDSNWKNLSIGSHESPGYPASPDDPTTPWGASVGIGGCDEVPVKGEMAAMPSAREAETPTGLGVKIDVPNPGLLNATGVASSDLKSVRVSLPEGMTFNPSQAEGLGVCSPAQYESTELSFLPTPGKGCPDDAKIATVQVKTPLLAESIPGDVYVAKPFDNPFGSLLALYVVMREPQRGILVKAAGKVETDERTGQITTTFDNLPQQPFSSLDFKFREGARAPLVTPQACGTYTTTADFTGWSSVDPETGKVDPADILHTSSDFEIDRGIGGGPCPSGGLPPFKPGLVAGSLNNAAGHYSPFNVRLFRTDAEQEFTNFSIKLPPGISGKLAGVPFCSDAAIAASKAKTGAQEIASPSCPAASEVGHTLAGAGVGSILTYAPGKIYLAGPYNGSALSIVSVTAAKVGPFDLGTVVVRLALRVDPETAEVFIDATNSDPIPHIIDGVTVHLRDIRAYVDKPEFTLNPTNCARTSTASTLLGSGLDFGSAIDDRPVTVSTPYQAADCAALAFKPKLSLKLKGGTKRGGHPSLRATLKMKGGEANIARAQVTLPKSEFLDQSHIGTVCTRVQYAKDQCPAKSVYGYAKAITPLLDEPLAGPVYLRSSEHKLPDLVAGLKSGKIEIDLAGRIDSVDGQIRTTFESVPDAPVSKFTLTMAGGRKSLLENSTNLCARPHKAIVEFDGQNGKIKDSTPVVKPQCKGKKSKAAKRRNAR